MNGITLNFMKCFFFKDNFQCFFSREGSNQSYRKLKKCTVVKCKSCLGFLNFVKQLISNYIALKQTRTSLKRTLNSTPKTLKYWVGVQWGQFYLMGRRCLFLALLHHPFLAFSDLTCHFEDTGIGVFWLHCAT